MVPAHSGTKWPLTGGDAPEVPYDNSEIEKLFIAGYQDGTVRLWYATYFVLVPVFVLEGKLPAIEVEVTLSAVTAIAFCSLSVTLAIGDECGLIRSFCKCFFVYEA
ncbi:uncharacterized protein LOC141818824 [Curcuma longa]|uniref:uncharacterized protein LOC141818824 n=1 Tax=Curcuma longa TaxID=136217 RepID=UPI003D9E1C50